MVVREGSNVTLKCAATGSPTPNITWKRESGDKIMLHGGNEGEYLFVSRIDKLHFSPVQKNSFETKFSFQCWPKQRTLYKVFCGVAFAFFLSCKVRLETNKFLSTCL